MINFDAVGISERRSEEVISFFWRSVYFKLQMYDNELHVLLKQNVTHPKWLESSEVSDCEL